VRKDGKRFWARVVVSALHDAEGRLLGFAKVTQDLSDRRHIQDLEKAARHVNEFIATLAHELRNPLAPIRSAVEVMGRIPAGDPRHDSLRGTIDRQSAQLARIVDDLIDIARLTRGTLGIERTPVDLAEVVRRAVETAAPAVEAGKHRLEIDLPPQALEVDGDLHRLTQLLSNLLNNAARYTPEGGRIMLLAGRDDGSALVRVRDTGRGIEPQLLERIFDMFVQGRSAIERVGGGLGVGLALARRIAEAHGGSLSAHSEGEGKGAELTLRLPLRDKAKGRSRAAKRPPAGAMVPRRILVVDDNVDAAVSLELLLKALGHEVRAAFDGSQALRMEAEFHPDVVLLDIGMPGLDGYEVARRLRALRHEQRDEQPLRIIAVTGWGQEADRSRSREAGFDVHLVKPVDPNLLTRVINNGTIVH
jgi:CheY-like chemotaxis protein/nitrogen-specific signal transduction histidine kinase